MDWVAKVTGGSLGTCLLRGGISDALSVLATANALSKGGCVWSWGSSEKRARVTKCRRAIQI